MCITGGDFDWRLLLRVVDLVVHHANVGFSPAFATKFLVVRFARSVWWLAGRCLLPGSVMNTQEQFRLRSGVG